MCQVASRIRITTPAFIFFAHLKNTATAIEVAKILPITCQVHTWGNECYFEIPIHVELEADATQEMPIGGLGFWPTGNALCLFFGKTPASINNEPRAISPVNHFGTILENAEKLKLVKEGDSICIELL